MIVPGQIYRHYKGALYTILTLATEVAEIGDSTKKVVVYQNMAEPEKIWTRELAIFEGDLDVDGKTVKRFTLVY